MDAITAEKVRARLPTERHLFHWFPDRDAFVLLAWESGEDGTRVRALKSGPRAALLNRPSVRAHLGALGRETVSAVDFTSHWPGEVEAFRYSFGRWPLEEPFRDHRGWNQMTRPGQHLVVRLDLPRSDLRTLTGQLESEHWIPDPTWHPVAPAPDLTLAWARVDLCPETGEALIEELQSDWVRNVPDELDYADGKELHVWRRYLKERYPTLRRIWPRAMLLATLELLRDTLGITRVFCHSPDAGARLKRIGGTPPPRSLYSSLPRRFTFQKTWNPPEFLKADRSVRLRQQILDPETWWWVLQL